MACAQTVRDSGVGSTRRSSERLAKLEVTRYSGGSALAVTETLDTTMSPESAALKQYL
jgi:hypothetical protein